MDAIRDVRELGEILRTARHALGLSAQEVAERSGVSKPTVTLLERGGIQQPRPRPLTKLATALGLNASDLLALAGYQPSDQLPGLGVYLRTTTTLPAQAIDELKGYFDYLHDKYGVNTDGPAPGEDEQDEQDE